MSLLLDALKKAETAKRKKGAGDGDGLAPDDRERSGGDAVARGGDLESSLSLLEPDQPVPTMTEPALPTVSMD